jgi:hypothetical protein
VKWPDLLSCLGRRRDAEPAFIYVAEAGITVESSAFGFNPALDPDQLAQIVGPAPFWLRGKQELLRGGWPDSTDLALLALMSGKTMLALGAGIPDGTVDEMQQQFDLLFPTLAEARTSKNPGEYRTFVFNVTIDADGPHRTGFGHRTGRTGRNIPIPNPIAPFFPEKPNSFFNWDVAMKNLIRLDLQRLIEAILQPTERRSDRLRV